MTGRSTRLIASEVLFLLLAALGSSSVLAQSPRTGPAHIVLVRHAEKPDDSENPHLSDAGRERADALAAFVLDDPQIRTLGRPVAIFATETTKDENGQRTQETVAPLAARLHLSVQTPFHGKDYDDLAKSIRSNAAYAGKTIVICWNHEVIPELVAALGVSPEPPKWKSKVFDAVYVITYTNGEATLSQSRYGR